MRGRWITKKGIYIYKSLNIFKNKLLECFLDSINLRVFVQNILPVHEMNILQGWMKHFELPHYVHVHYWNVEDRLMTNVNKFPWQHFAIYVVYNESKPSVIEWVYRYKILGWPWNAAKHRNWGYISYEFYSYLVYGTRPENFVKHFRELKCRFRAD